MRICNVYTFKFVYFPLAAIITVMSINYDNNWQYMTHFLWFSFYHKFPRHWETIAMRSFGVVWESIFFYKLGLQTFHCIITEIVYSKITVTVSQQNGLCYKFQVESERLIDFMRSFSSQQPSRNCNIAWLLFYNFIPAAC